MTEPAAQQPARSFNRLALWPLGVVVLVMGFALFGERGVLHLLRLQQQQSVLVGELADVERQNEELRREIAALTSDRRHIERVARAELGMVRQDELVFQFSAKSSSPASQPATSQ